jgi:small subunit ribosomal protein S17
LIVTKAAAVSETNSNAAGASNNGEPATGESYKRRLIGLVASDKMQKTVVVEVVRYKLNQMYKKHVKIRTRYQAHDENNDYHVGDRVEIMEHRPLSKHKRWTVVRLIEKAQNE